ncbi:site-2 protease family protein [Singulisphaera rosea]
MMTDPLLWSPISLGRWFGTEVRVHISLAIFVFLELLSAAFSSSRFEHTACWIGLLLLALIVHEIGHALAASWVGVEPDEVRLWPLGNMVGASVASRSNESVGVAFGGLAANLLVVIATVGGLWLADAQFVWHPFGNPEDSGAPWIGDKKATAWSMIWFVGWFGYLNYVLLLANLIPALPFDMGRALRTYLANSSMTQAKDGLLAPYTARTFAAILGIAGMIRLVQQNVDGVTLIGLAILIELIVRSEARMLEDGGFFDDGVFGYDFSEGYTSLEGSAAKVRPYRESALKRWRRRRSDSRRQRRMAREAAEERRMDEILEKLHRDGRHSLSDEEHRFLLRVSAKYRNRPKASD